ncbi:NAD(P)HX epimerase [Bacillus sp. JCM 19045]|nr:NAD(P)HX epimerase [Bacillus sp. JCM 19045]
MRIVTGEEMASIDAITINKIGLPGVVLMENAGREIARRLIDLYGMEKRFLLFIGKGNNGGDGFAVARMLKEQGVSVVTCIVEDEAIFEGDAKLHKRVYEQSGYRWRYWKEMNRTWSEVLCEVDVVVDAMLGTGLRGAIREPYTSIIKKINLADKEIVSIDLPSGVPAGEAEMEGEPISADRTFTLQLMKLSYYLEATKPYYGEVETLPIGIPPATMNHLEAQRCVWGKDEVVNSWVKSNPFAHKGSNGRIGVIAGSQRMPGAAALSASAAIRGGAGLTTVGTVGTAIQTVATHVKEAMYTAFSEQSGMIAPTEEELFAFYEGKAAIAIGPGIGRSTRIKAMIAHAIEHYTGILILDADALVYVSELHDEVKKRRSPLVLTPHIGEMAHLANESVDVVKQYRFTIAETYAQTYQAHIILKGPHTIVANPNGGMTVNHSGNAGLAKGGSGDVLTGIVTALVARQPLETALSTAVFLHGHAADLLINQGFSINSLTPSDLIEGLAEAYKLCE